MTVTIFVTHEAWKTSQAIKDYDYYDRCTLADDPTTDPTGKEGYYLKNANVMKTEPIPATARIALTILRSDSALHSRHISVPTNLRGCIFTKALNTPEGYAEIIKYWTGSTVNSNVGNSAYYQNQTQAYQIDLSALEADPDLFSQWRSSDKVDALVSEGVVVAITSLDDLIADAEGGDFVEIEVPIDDGLLGLDNGEFMTQKAYNLHRGERSERIYLQVSDIRNSPDPARIYLDLLRYEEGDYGFYY